MTKKEKDIILNRYKEIYHVNTNLKIDKYDSLRELGFLLTDLGLKKELYMMQNEVIAENLNLSLSVKECYSMIFDSFVKHGVFTNFNLDEINTYFQELQYEFTEDEYKYHNNRIKYILEYS